MACSHPDPVLSVEPGHHRSATHGLVDWLADAFEAPATDTASVRFALADGAPALTAPVQLAEYCPVVVGAAADGDVIAGRILDEAADLLVESTAALRPAHGEPLVTAGGLLGPRGPLPERFAVRVSARGLSPYPVADGLEGAVVLARRTGSRTAGPFRDAALSTVEGAHT